MAQHKIMTVYGTRPEAIKVAPVIDALEQDERFDSIPVVTGQHREMLDQVNAMFGIEPEHDLGLMVHGQSLNSIVSRAIAGLDQLLEQHAPAAVLAQGDTSTAMAAAIAAFNRRIPVVHLEAGLRTGDLAAPFPEEANRRLVASIAALHLAPTAGAARNLLREATPREDVVVTGNTVIDALEQATRWASPFADPALEALVASGRRLVLATTHRRENLGASMDAIGRALAQIARTRPDLAVVLPLHRNPAVRAAVLPHLDEVENVHVTEPLSYGEFTRAMGAATLVLTDSGGVQEEAPSLGKPVLVLRETTERPEAVEAGTVRLIGTDSDRIVSESLRLLDDNAAYAEMANAVNPYGDGRASGRAVAAIAALLGIGEREPDFDA
ncbi:UDP-N-acetylglucosamine 2-epimerase (non-hydrolyzing) [Agrococcus terreus]|uniref:non-hydrolyzing UDP-N-acetylglucosamine 2-epimerase n=1 Tax=Agrococcus terreus TaxID=574649 RepID=UPI00385067D9